MWEYIGVCVLIFVVGFGLQFALLQYLNHK